MNRGTLATWQNQQAKKRKAPPVVEERRIQACPTNEQVYKAAIVQQITLELDRSSHGPALTERERGRIDAHLLKVARTIKQCKSLFKKQGVNTEVIASLEKEAYYEVMSLINPKD